MVFTVVTSDGDVMLTWPYIYRGSQWFLEELMLLWIERTLHLATGLCAMPHKRKKTSVGCEKIPVITSLLTSGCLTPQIIISLIIMWGAVEQKTNKTLCNTEIELKARIMATFSNLNKETIWKAFKGDSVVFWMLGLKPMLISLNKFIVFQDIF